MRAALCLPPSSTCSPALQSPWLSPLQPGAFLRFLTATSCSFNLDVASKSTEECKFDSQGVHVR